MIGFVAGGGIGLVSGAIKTAWEITNEENSIPIQSKTIEWNVPVVQNNVIGQIPNDYYQHNGFSPPLLTMKNVTVDL